jgi:uncharacterized protein YdaU (DUF1376 family)
MAENPYMKLYGRDYLASTRHLTCAARGAYVDLLILAWFDEGVPADPEILRRMVGAEPKDWRGIWPQLEPKWPVSADDKRRNPREEEERAKARLVSSKRSESGKAGVAARAKQASSKPEANGQANAKLSVAVADTDHRSDTQSVSDVVRGSAPPAPETHTPPTGPDVTAWGPTPARSHSPANAWQGTRKGLSVPQFLHDELVSRMATPDDAALRAWYAETERAFNGRAIGETNLQFWRARFAEWQGVTTLKPVKVVGLTGGGVAPRTTPEPVAVTDPDYRGKPHRFVCSHTPTCARWPEHRDRDAETVRNA